jgi:hypothetical protein
MRPTSATATRKTLRNVVVGATVALALAAADTAVQASDPHGARHRGPGRSIEGTWTLQITFADCQTGAEIPNATIPGLNTFLAGGSVLSDPAANPALLRTGHGVWQHLDGRQFTNTLVLFRFNPNGSYAGTQTVRRNIEVSHHADEFFTRDTATSADPNGNVVDIRCAIGRGRRLE